MCCSLKPAKFSKTKGLAAEAKRGRKLVHLLGYGNNVINLAGNGSAVTSSPTGRSTRSSYGRGGRSAQPTQSGVGNAMFLPIPARPGTMTEANVIDTTSCPNFLKDMERAIQVSNGSRGGMRRGPVGKGLPDSVQIFDHDIYTIVLASDANDIPGALSHVRADRRPDLNDPIFQAYARWYDSWTFALCCFNTAQEAAAKPLLWWYEPQNRDLLFFPAIDAHDGNVPDLGAQVDVDHALIFGSHLTAAGAGNQVTYSDAGMDSAIAKLLPTHVTGQQYGQRMQQGDFVMSVADVRSGRLNIQRELPPGA